MKPKAPFKRVPVPIANEAGDEELFPDESFDFVGDGSAGQTVHPETHSASGTDLPATVLPDKSGGADT